MGDLGIRSARIKPYRLAYSSRAATKYGPFRHGRLVSLTSDSGVTGWGDAAPLPGFSPETVDDVDRVFTVVAENLDRLDYGELARLDQLPPSLVFGLEQALLSIEAQVSSRLPPALISSEHRPRIGISGLVDCSPEEAGEQSRALIDAGSSCLKLKVGHWPPKQGAVTIQDIRRSLGPEVEIRLDANRAWSLGEATQFLDGISQSDISYVEEPLRDSSSLHVLASRTSVALALDESLTGLDSGRLSDFSFARCVVLKPTILGGIRRSIELAHEASELGMKSVVSSTFESGLGVVWLVALSASPIFDETAGIGTGHYLEADTMRPRLQLGFRCGVEVTERALETFEFDD